MNGWKQLRTLVLALIALAALGIPDAHAAQGRHCAYELDPVSKIGRVTQAQLVLIGCYDTFAEAVSAGTGGSVTLDASASPDQTTDAELAGSDTRGLVTIGTEWGGSGFTGASNSYLAST